MSGKPSIASFKRGEIPIHLRHDYALLKQIIRSPDYKPGETRRDKLPLFRNKGSDGRKGDPLPSLTAEMVYVEGRLGEAREGDPISKKGKERVFFKLRRSDKAIMVVYYCNNHIEKDNIVVVYQKP